jgi:hypothetical protein
MLTRFINGLFKNKVMKINDIIQFGGIYLPEVGKSHESITRSFHTLKKVMEMVGRGDSKETIIEVEEFLSSYSPLALPGRDVKEYSVSLQTFYENLSQLFTVMRVLFASSNNDASLLDQDTEWEKMLERNSLLQLYYSTKHRATGSGK